MISGYSTGCFHKFGYSLDQSVRECLSLNNKSIEICFADTKELDDFSLAEDTLKALRKMWFVSVHAPWRGITYSDNPETRQVIDKIWKLFKLMPVVSVVMHPDSIDDYDILNKSELPIAIENMGRKHRLGHSNSEIEYLIENTGFEFVLDLQHAYQIDPSMELAYHIFEKIEKEHRISHLHVSGQTKDHNHAPLSISDNREVICSALEYMAEARNKYAISEEDLYLTRK